MNVEVIFHFDHIDIKSAITIMNPPVLPVAGDMIDFEWEKYIKDKAELEFLIKFDENQSYRVDFISKTYSPEKVTVKAFLIEDTTYDREIESLRCKAHL